jgi:type IV pilus assembly protein PilP
MHLHRKARDLRVGLLIVGLSAVPAWAGAQVAAPAVVAPPAAAPVPTPPPTPVERAPADSYTYEPSGRRDPFLNLLGFTEVQVQAVGVPRHVDGVGGLSVSETTVRGVMKSRGALIALVQGTDKKTFVVHQGDKLLDGTIMSVVPEGLVIMQPVNDPLSSVKQREVRKLLRSVEDGKQ